MKYEVFYKKKEDIRAFRYSKARESHSHNVSYRGGHEMGWTGWNKHILGYWVGMCDFGLLVNCFVEGCGLQYSKFSKLICMGNFRLLGKLKLFKKFIFY